MRKKLFKELNLSDAFLFAAAMSDPENCRLMLEMILGIPIGKLTVHSEHNVLFSSDYKSVRLDVFASSEMRVDYDVEMENAEENLAKRSRFYQVRMDSSALKPGEDYTALRPNYIIFICTYDPFGFGLYRYVFENCCRERGFPLGDGTTKIFLSTKGSNREEVPEELVSFLHYVEDSSDRSVRSEDRTLAELHTRIVQLKKTREWEESYMTLEDYVQKKIDMGIHEGMQDLNVGEPFKLGLERGQNCLLKLIQSMCANGEADRIPELSSDPAFLKDAYRRYGISEFLHE